MRVHLRNFMVSPDYPFPCRFVTVFLRRRVIWDEL